MGRDSGRASMRPRHQGRGERRRRRRVVTELVSFNAATAPRPWRTSRKRPAGAAFSQLQCGHGTKAVENRATGDVMYKEGIASMRPRHQGRGEQWTCDQETTPGRTRFNAATAPRPWRTIVDVYGPYTNDGLQCGHGTKAVENPVQSR